jgi:hypothetical protein
MKLSPYTIRNVAIVLAILSLPMAWIAYQPFWIHQRHAFMNGPPKLVNSALPQDAPWPLGWFGERGISEITIVDPTSTQRAHELFPESELMIRDKSAPDGFRIIRPDKKYWPKN